MQSSSIQPRTTLEAFPTAPECPFGAQPGWASPTDVRGFHVVSGTGETLGRVTQILCDRHGNPKWLAFEELGSGTPRKVQLRFIRRWSDGRVEIAGPREGYHITRLGP